MPTTSVAQAAILGEMSQEAMSRPRLAVDKKLRRRLSKIFQLAHRNQLEQHESEKDGGCPLPDTGNKDKACNQRQEEDKETADACKIDGGVVVVNPCQAPITEPLPAGKLPNQLCPALPDQPGADVVAPFIRHCLTPRLDRQRDNALCDLFFGHGAG